MELDFKELLAEWRMIEAQSSGGSIVSPESTKPNPILPPKTPVQQAPQTSLAKQVNGLKQPKIPQPKLPKMSSSPIAAAQPAIPGSITQTPPVGIFGASKSIDPTKAPTHTSTPLSPKRKAPAIGVTGKAKPTPPTGMGIV
jgi:hypothetical protein